MHMSVRKSVCTLCVYVCVWCVCVRVPVPVPVCVCACVCAFDNDYSSYTGKEATPEQAVSLPRSREDGK